MGGSPRNTAYHTDRLPYASRIFIASAHHQGSSGSYFAARIAPVWRSLSTRACLQTITSVRLPQSSTSPDRSRPASHNGSRSAFCPRRMLVGADDRAIDIGQDPMELAGRISLLCEGVQEALKEARAAPAVEATRHRLPAAIALWQVSPGAPVSKIHTMPLRRLACRDACTLARDIPSRWAGGAWTRAGRAFKSIARCSAESSRVSVSARTW